MPRNIICFTANLMSFLIRNEECFIKLNFANIIEDFVEIMRRIPEPDEYYEIKVSYINLIASFLQHNSGLQWLMVTNYWFDVITMASQGSLNVEMTKNSITFILNLLEESSKQNAVFCKTAIKMIVTPLTDISVSSSTDKDVSVIETKAMKYTLNLLNNILEALLERSCITRNFTVFDIFVDNFDLEKKLNDIIALVTHEDTFIMLNLILNAVLYGLQAREFVSANGITENISNLSSRISDIMIKVVNRCQQYHKLFLILEKSYLFGRYTYEKMHGGMSRHNMAKNYAADIFQHQLILFLLWPITETTLSMNSESDEMRQDLYSKVIKSIHALSFRALKEIRKAIHSFTMEDSVKALEYLQRCSQFFLHNVANMTTQILICRFDDIMSELDDFQGINYWPQDFIGMFIETLVLMISKFDLSWKDSVETVYVTDLAMRILNQPFWTAKVSKLFKC